MINNSMDQFRQAFARAAARPDGTSGINFLEAILREKEEDHWREKIESGELTAYFPGVEANKYNGKGDPSGHFQGANSVVVFIGDEVFKGPIDPGPPGYFDKEAETLRSLEGSGLPVPRVTCIGKDSYFYGMTRLPGVQLPEDFLYSFTPDQIEQLAEDLAGFMARLAEFLPVEPDGSRAALTDLQPKNILIDPETRRLSGIVDIEIMYRNLPTKMTVRKLRSLTDLAAFNKLIEEDRRVRKAFGQQGFFSSMRDRLMPGKAVKL